MRSLAGPDALAGRGAIAAAAAIAGVAACLLAGLSVAYRRTLVRQLRLRHRAVWEELAGSGEGAAQRWRGHQRLSAFLRAGRHYVLNDADVAAAGRLTVVTGRAAVVVAAAGAWLVWLLLG